MPSANHPLIQNMMKYILGFFIPEIGNWGRSHRTRGQRRRSLQLGSLQGRRYETDRQ